MHEWLSQWNRAGSELSCASGKVNVVRKRSVSEYLCTVKVEFHIEVRIGDA